MRHQRKALCAVMLKICYSNKNKIFKTWGGPNSLLCNFQQLTPILNSGSGNQLSIALLKVAALCLNQMKNLLEFPHPIRDCSSVQNSLKAHCEVKVCICIRILTIQFISACFNTLAQFKQMLHCILTNKANCPNMNPPVLSSYSPTEQNLTPVEKILRF